MSEALLNARRLMAEALDISLDEISPEASFADLSGWDSLVFMRFILALENFLGQRIGPEDVFAIEGVSSVVELINLKNEKPSQKNTPAITNCTIEKLIERYKAELVTPVDEKMHQLSQKHIEPNIDFIFHDLTKLRAKTDAHFLAMRERMLRGEITLILDQRRKLTNYPIKCCLEITRHMLKLISNHSGTYGSKGIQALQNFHREGGKVKRIWGALREQYFQNATQAGSYYIDVANDTVDITKDKVEILPLDQSGFRNIVSYDHFADVAEIYWKCRIIPNTVFPNLAPFLPMIILYGNGEISLESANSFMFPMNLESKFKLSKNFIFPKTKKTAHEEEYRILQELYVPESKLGDDDLLCFRSPTNQQQLKRSFAKCISANTTELTLETNKALAAKASLNRTYKQPR